MAGILLDHRVKPAKLEVVARNIARIMFPQADHERYGRVTAGDYSPAVPTDPDMPNSGIRLLDLDSRYVA